MFFIKAMWHMAGEAVKYLKGIKCCQKKKVIACNQPESTVSSQKENVKMKKIPFIQDRTNSLHYFILIKKLFKYFSALSYVKRLQVEIEF